MRRKPPAALIFIAWHCFNSVIFQTREVISPVNPANERPTAPKSCKSVASRGGTLFVRLGEKWHYNYQSCKWNRWFTPCVRFRRLWSNLLEFFVFEAPDTVLRLTGKKLCPIQIDPVGRILWTRRRGGSQKTAIYTSNLYCFNDLFKFWFCQIADTTRHCLPTQGVNWMRALPLLFILIYIAMLTLQIYICYLCKLDVQSGISLPLKSRSILQYPHYGWSEIRSECGAQGRN